MLFSVYLLTCFRISLLAMFALIPNFLISLHQYRPLEIGPLAIITGFVTLLVAPLVAVAISKFDVRIVGALGCLLIALALFGDAHILSVWLRQDFLLLQVVLAIGTPMVLISATCVQLYSGLKRENRPVE
jgi:MFS transporter, DHA2 family, multidrug resistance protein